MARKSRVRTNIGRYQKYATINITKTLEQAAKELQIDLEKNISEEVLKVYKENVLKSYSPRSESGKAVAEYNKQKKSEEQEDKEKYGIKSRRSRKKLTYHHTGIFLDSIYTKTENKAVKVMIKKIVYPDETGMRSEERSTLDVYEYLVHGTNGGGVYPYKIGENGKIIFSPNYKTPEHLFEEHTQIQMKAYLESLKQSVKRRKYTKRR